MTLLTDLRVIGALFLEQAADLWPFYLGGAAFAAFIKTFKWDRRVRASLVRYDRASVLVAVAAGLVSPLCSCGILPVVIALSAAGVPLPPVLALLITSPLMSPDAFLVTLGQLGWVYAAWKLCVATAVGLSTGFLALWLTRRGWLSATSFRVEKIYTEEGKPRPGFEELVAAGCFSHAAAEASPPAVALPAAGPGHRPLLRFAAASAPPVGGGPGSGLSARFRWQDLREALLGGAVVDRESRALFFLERFRDMALLMGKYLAVALLIQAGFTYYVPANAIEPLLGGGSPLSVLFAALVAIPLPLPQVAAPPVIKGLLASGMGPGAAMAMLVGGPVTSIPAFSALLGVYDRRAFALYFAVGILATLAAGLLFQSVYG